jgi:predicted ATPase/class 3 adenylate cyclase
MNDETVLRRLAAILFADAVGYSRLMAEDELATARMLRAHLERMAAAIARHGGRVVDAVGDNLLAEFASVVEAAACAAEIQRHLAEHNAALAETKRMPFRIGLHLGDVIVEGDRIRGDGVNVAARIEGLAPPGGLAISGAAFDQIEGRLGIDFADLGELALKNIPRPTRVYVARLGTEVGAARGEEAAPLPVAAPPRPRTRFIGRGDARREIAAALAADRIVTLTGVGGCGKSRLAWQVADDLAHAFAAGVRSADLTSASASGQVPAAVAAAAGLVSQRTGIEFPAGEKLVHGIGDQHLLLVLDNCEHVVEGAAELADLLLSRCPQLAILATSREPLDIEGEHVWQVPPLQVAPAEADFDEGRSCEAVALFADRAAAARGGFALTAETYGEVRQICERLDGIPLAIELAAARVRHLSVEEIAARLDDRFRLLSERSRRSDRRHQTLLATIEWSDGLLDARQRALFYRLAVFVGRFAFDAVEAVCGTAPLDPGATLDTLGALVDRSLVETEERRGGTRYRLLETIRAYAAAKLAGTSEQDELRTRHRDWFAEIARGHTRSLFAERLSGPPRSPAAQDAILAHDVANLRAATEWSLERGDTEASLHLAATTGDILLNGGHPSDAIDLTARALAARGSAEPDAVLGAGIVQAAALMRVGDFSAAFDRYESVVSEAAGQPGYEHVASLARSAQSIAAHASGKGDAEKLAQAAVESARACSDAHGEYAGLSQLAATRLINGRFSEAAEILGGLLERFPGSPGHYGNAAYYVVATVLSGDEAAAARGYAHLMTLPPTAEDPFARSWFAWSFERARALWCAATGNHAAADQALAEGLEYQRRAPVPLADADYLVTAGAVAFFAGDPERAARLLGAARTVMDRFRSWRGHDAGPTYVAFRKRCEEALGSERARALLQEGRALRTDDALAQLRASVAPRR